jgi:hypothetical protein
VQKKGPLHPLSNSERRALEQLARRHSAPALSSKVTRATDGGEARRERRRRPSIAPNVRKQRHSRSHRGSSISTWTATR